MTVAFLSIFFLIYPGGFLRGLGVADMPPTVTFEGLEDEYKVGEELQFSVRLEGYWNDCGIFPGTEVLISSDRGSSYDVVIWQDAGTAHDYDNPGCDHDADRIDKTRHVKGNPFSPWIFREAGIYEVKSYGDDIQGSSHRFVVKS